VNRRAPGDAVWEHCLDQGKIFLDYLHTYRTLQPGRHYDIPKYVAREAAEMMLFILCFVRRRSTGIAVPNPLVSRHTFRNPSDIMPTR